MCSGFGSLADNFLLFEHCLSLRESEATEAISRLLRSFQSLAMTSFLRFLAKNSNARYTKSLRFRLEKVKK